MLVAVTPGPAMEFREKLAGQAPRNAVPVLIGVSQARGHDVLRSKAKDQTRALTVWLNSCNVLNHCGCIAEIQGLFSPRFGKPVGAQPPGRMQLDIEFKF